MCLQTQTEVGSKLVAVKCERCGNCSNSAEKRGLCLRCIHCIQSLTPPWVLASFVRVSSCCRATVCNSYWKSKGAPLSEGQSSSVQKRPLCAKHLYVREFIFLATECGCTNTFTVAVVFSSIFECSGDWEIAETLLYWRCNKQQNSFFYSFVLPMLIIFPLDQQ